MRATHSASSRAKKPLSPSRTISVVAPTGDAITGTPHAMYWTALKPDLPSDQASSTSG